MVTRPSILHHGCNDSNLIICIIRDEHSGDASHGGFPKKRMSKTYDNRDLPMNIHLAAKSLVKRQWSMSVFPVSY